MTTIAAAMAAARRRLAAAGVGTAGLDVRVLASAAFGLDGAGLIAHDDLVPADAALAAFEGFITRRASGMPVGRILGIRAFRGHDFLLSPDTLEPRPDTETLVDLAIRLVTTSQIPGAGADGTGLVFADIGTGSGAIAVSIAAELPGARGIATDIAPGALATARLNAERARVADRLDFRLGDHLEPVELPVGLIVSNPPYIASAEVDGLDLEVRAHDPRLALDGGPDGLASYRKLAAGAPTRLIPGGVLAVEIGWALGPAVIQLLADAGLHEIAMCHDLAGLDRVVFGRLSG